MKKNTRSNRAISVGAALLGATVMVASALPSLGGIDQQGQRTHLVKEGESLWTIAKRELGSGLRWFEIYQLNRRKLKNPSRIFPNQIILLPGKEKARTTPSIAPTPVPTETPTTAPSPEATNTPSPVPTETPIPVPSPAMTDAPASTPSPAPSPTAAPGISLGLGYWAANNETGTSFFGSNNGAITAEVEWMPPGTERAIGFSGAAHTFPTRFSSGIWDAYYRTGILKVGYRSDDLLRRQIPHGSTTKQDLHAESLITGLTFGLALSEETALRFDLLGGSTFHNVAVGTSERVLTDLGANVRTRVHGLDLTLGYRSYVFGTFGDLRNLYTGKNERSVAFGSYQGPTAGLQFRF